MQIKRTFIKEKETKNTIRFMEKETDEDKIGTVIGPLYIQKNALSELGFTDGDTITITIEK
ncbi:MAG: hypothetical protein VZS44_10745 [Bacilli bacterium]|nr:hypothetical protein [Bacilli bacterium]